MRKDFDQNLHCRKLLCWDVIVVGQRLISKFTKLSCLPAQVPEVIWQRECLHWLQQATLQRGRYWESQIIGVQAWPDWLLARFLKYIHGVRCSPWFHSAPLWEWSAVGLPIWDLYNWGPEPLHQHQASSHMDKLSHRVRGSAASIFLLHGDWKPQSYSQ